ncbi:MAG TPA: hypothetical protein VGR72_06740 [Candidatus Acidoferrales bacterium]|nr:hypothetical protein [Candidatus Acidoferrales bacterium]
MNSAVVAGALIALLILLRFWKGFPKFVLQMLDNALDRLVALLGAILPTYAYKRKVKIKAAAPQPAEQIAKWTAAVKLVMALIITVAFGGIAVYFLFSNNADKHAKEWAYGMIGTIAGYWLK